MLLITYVCYIDNNVFDVTFVKGHLSVGINITDYHMAFWKLWRQGTCTTRNFQLSNICSRFSLGRMYQSHLTCNSWWWFLRLNRNTHLFSVYHSNHMFYKVFVESLLSPGDSLEKKTPELFSTSITVEKIAVFLFRRR